MFDWFEKHPGTANWVQVVGSVAAIWYAARIASKSERQQRERTWDAAISYANQVVQVLQELRDACSKKNREWIQRFPYVLDDLTDFGQSISLELLPPKNALNWFCELRPIIPQAKSKLDELLKNMDGKKELAYDDAEVSFNGLYTKALVLRGRLVMVRHIRITLLNKIKIWFKKLKNAIKLVFQIILFVTINFACLY